MPRHSFLDQDQKKRITGKSSTLTIIDYCLHDFYANLYRQYFADLLKTALYVRKVITTPAIRAHLEQRHPATLDELSAIVMET